MKTHQAELERLREAHSQSTRQNKVWQQVRTDTLPWSILVKAFGLPFENVKFTKTYGVGGSLVATTTVLKESPDPISC